jgi:hypothetical protein
MLFHVTWELTDQTEEGSRRSLAVFSKWQPPEGANFQGFYAFADGAGGVAIIEVDSAPPPWPGRPHRGHHGSASR